MASKRMMIMRMSRIIPVLASPMILILPTLFPSSGGNNLGLLQKAEGATINITTNTTWGDKTFPKGTVINVAAGVTLTIIGRVEPNRCPNQR